MQRDGDSPCDDGTPHSGLAMAGPDPSPAGQPPPGTPIRLPDRHDSPGDVPIWQNRAMADDTPDTPKVPDPREVLKNPAELKEALGRTGRMLKRAGLPFEEEEFEDEAAGESSGSAKEQQPDEPATD